MEHQLADATDGGRMASGCFLDMELAIPRAPQSSLPCVCAFAKQNEASPSEPSTRAISQARNSDCQVVNRAVAGGGGATGTDCIQLNV